MSQANAVCPTSIEGSFQFFCYNYALFFISDNRMQEKIAKQLGLYCVKLKSDILLVQVGRRFFFEAQSTKQPSLVLM